MKEKLKSLKAKLKEFVNEPKIRISVLVISLLVFVGIMIFSSRISKNKEIAKLPSNQEIRENGWN